MKKKDTIKMSNEERQAYYKKLKAEYDKDPRKANGEFKKYMDESSQQLIVEGIRNEMHSIWTKGRRDILKAERSKYSFALKSLETDERRFIRITQGDRELRFTLIDLRRIVDYLDHLLEMPDVTPSEYSGLGINLSDTQINALYKKVKDVYLECSEDSFKAMTGSKRFPPNTPRPIWLIYHGQKPNGQAARIFFKTLGVKLRTGESVIQCVTDKENNPLKITNENKNRGNYWKKKFEKLLEVE